MSAADVSPYEECGNKTMNHPCAPLVCTRPRGHGGWCLDATKVIGFPAEPAPAPEGRQA